MGINRSQYIVGSLVAGLGAAWRPASAQNASLPIRVGATPNDTYSEAYYALEMGLFQKAGLAAEVQSLNNGAAVSAAVASGALDVGVSTPAQLANAVSRGVPFVMIAAGALETPKVPVGLLAVAKSGPLRSAKDLEGKIVALNSLRTLQEAALMLWLAKGGADVSKVKVVEIVAAEQGAAIERGTIDAAVLGEPSQSIAIKTGNLRVLADPYAAIAPQFLVSGWFSTIPWVQKNPDVVKRFQTAIYEAGRWANGHHNESAVILSKYTKMDVEIIRAMGRCPFTDQLRISDIQPHLDAAVKVGIIPRAMSASELLIRP
jgi:NitT/TauT family transport system substrate-binding protein